MHGYLVERVLALFGSRREKAGAALGAVLCMIVMLRNASRGAFLAALAGGFYLVLMARRHARRYVLSGVALAALALMVLMNAEHREAMYAPHDHLCTEERREASAEHRVQYSRTGG